MPKQVLKVSSVATAQRLMPMFTWPLSISASELISGTPGTKSNTLAAVAISGCAPQPNFSAVPDTIEATNAVTANTTAGL